VQHRRFDRSQVQVQGKFSGFGPQPMTLRGDDRLPGVDVDGHGVGLFGAGHGKHRTGHPLGLQVAAAGDITDRGMGQVNLVGAPGRGRFGPIAAMAGRLQPAAKKGELETEATVVHRRSDCRCNTTTRYGSPGGNHDRMERRGGRDR
jgi:hypothetical protein